MTNPLELDADVATAPPAAERPPQRAAFPWLELPLAVMWKQSAWGLDGDAARPGSWLDRPRHALD